MLHLTLEWFVKACLEVRVPQWWRLICINSFTCAAQLSSKSRKHSTTCNVPGVLPLSAFFGPIIFTSVCCWKMVEIKASDTSFYRYLLVECIWRNLSAVYISKLIIFNSSVRSHFRIHLMRLILSTNPQLKWFLARSLTRGVSWKPRCPFESIWARRISTAALITAGGRGLLNQSVFEEDRGYQTLFSVCYWHFSINRRRFRPGQRELIRCCLISILNRLVKSSLSRPRQI